MTIDEAITEINQNGLIINNTFQLPQGDGTSHWIVYLSDYNFHPNRFTFIPGKGTGRTLLQALTNAMDNSHKIRNAPIPKPIPIPTSPLTTTKTLDELGL